MKKEKVETPFDKVQIEIIADNKKHKDLKKGAVYTVSRDTAENLVDKKLAKLK